MKIAFARDRGDPTWSLCSSCNALTRNINRTVAESIKRGDAPPSKFQSHASLLSQKGPSALLDRTAELAKQLKACNRQRNRLLATMHREATGIDIEVGAEQDAITDAIIEADEEVKKALAVKGFDDSSLERMVWDESVENAARIKRSGTRMVAR
jgi:hypothetical protein